MKLIILLLFFLLTPSMVIAAGPDKPLLEIATRHIPPFAIKNESGDWSGLSIELWRMMAEQMNVNYRFTEMGLNQMLETVTNNKVDAAIAALSITREREAEMDFTHSFMNTGLGIAVPGKENAGLFGQMKRLLSIEFLQVLAALLGLLLIVGILIWLLEKRNNQQFGGETAEGIGSGFWWSAVTMTTVGYGDKAPVTLGGRFVAVVWMFASVIIISYFTAAIATALTVDRLSGKVRNQNDLFNVRTATVSNSTSEHYLKQRGIRYQGLSDLPEALDALARGRFDAVVYDAPILKYRVRENHAETVNVLPITFERQGYGIALPAGSKHREAMNRAMLGILNTSKWDKLLNKYLGSAI